jgi:hypothetical protein
MAKLANGFYQGRLKNACLAMTDNNVPYVCLTFDIESRIEMGEEIYLDRPEERDVKFFMGDNSKEYAERDLERIGFNGNYADMKFNQELYDGVKLYAEQSTNPKDGKTYQNWRITGTGMAKEKKPAPTDLIKQLNAEWRAHGHAKPAFSEAPTQKQQPKQPAMATATATVDNDDIPF